MKDIEVLLVIIHIYVYVHNKSSQTGYGCDESDITRVWL